MIVAVNATANRESGALTILYQFIDFIRKYNKEVQFIFFVCDLISFDKVENIQFVKVNTRSFASRIKWDERGLENWFVVNKKTPDLIISFQNTGVNCNKKIPQIIYFHNQICVEKHNWNPFKRDERIYFFYQNVYPWIIRRHLNKTKFVAVQTESVKRAFGKKFNYSLNNIKVITPDENKIDYSSIQKHEFGDSDIHLFYAATPFAHKNHIILIKAIEILHRKGLARGLKIHFTCIADRNIPFVDYIYRKSLDNYFVFEGTLPFNKVLSYYKSVDALLFPSYIETVGLPLIEAASAGLFIVCSDLPYTHEVLGGYEGANYIRHTKPEEWADAIYRIGKRTKLYAFNKEKQANSWNDFFLLINSYNNVKGI